MKKYKSLITSSLLVGFIVAAPFVGFAESNKKGDDNEKKIEKSGMMQSENNQKDNSFFKPNWFKSHNLKDTTTPIISNVVATQSNNAQKAKISWTTDVKSNSLVWFSTTSPVDTSVNKMMFKKRNVKTLNHSIELKRLLPSTKYYVIVGSANGIGIAKSAEISFTTKDIVNNGNPVIVNLSGPTTIAVGAAETVTVTANNPGNGLLTYSADWGDANIISNNLLAASSAPAYVQTATFNHVYTTAGTYTATFTARNSEGKQDTSSMKITVTGVVTDTTAPVISNVETRINGSNVTIAWTTNELSTSNILYSTITPLDVAASTTTLIKDSSLATNHSLNIPGLTSNTLYHFIVKSVDASSNTVSSNELSFRTN